jgi:ribose 1,5-bisphosphokinase PhnN
MPASRQLVCSHLVSGVLDAVACAVQCAACLVAGLVACSTHILNSLLQRGKENQEDTNTCLERRLATTRSTIGFQVTVSHRRHDRSPAGCSGLQNHY